LKLNMTRQIKSAVTAVAVLAMVGSTQAASYNSDLVIGFTDSVGNDKVYDLGPAASLVNGQQWNIASLLSSFTLSSVSWGIVGSATIGTARTVWVTTAGTDPMLVPNTSAWGKINTADAAIYASFTTAGPGQSASIIPTDPNSWNQQTINGGGFTQYHNVYEDPNVFGLTCASFYRVVSPSLPPTLLGSFCLAANGVVTFTAGTVTPPPPPAPVLRVARAGNVTTISFLSTNTATYTLFYTNSSGLTTPVANWPSLPGMISGNNSITNFTDITTAPNRFYRVEAQ
jgi:hypothetical protein